MCAKNCDTVQRYYEYGLPMTRDRAGDGSGRFLSGQITDASNNLLRTSYVRYEHDLEYQGAATLQDMTRSNQRVAAQRTVFDDDGGVAAGETYTDFDGLGHYRTRSTGGTFPDVNSHTASTGYNPGQGTYGQASYSPWPVSSPWVLGTYTFQWDLENGQYKTRSFCFDQRRERFELPDERRRRGLHRRRRRQRDPRELLRG